MAIPIGAIMKGVQIAAPLIGDVAPRVGNGIGNLANKIGDKIGGHRKGGKFFKGVGRFFNKIANGIRSIFGGGGAQKLIGHAQDTFNTGRDIVGGVRDAWQSGNRGDAIQTAVNGAGVMGDMINAGVNDVRGMIPHTAIRQQEAPLQQAELGGFAVRQPALPLQQAYEGTYKKRRVL